MKMKVFLIKIFWLFTLCGAYDIFPQFIELDYKLNGSISIIPDVHATDNSEWILRGLIRVQRQDEKTIVMKIILDPGTYPDDISVNTLMEPFKIITLNETAVNPSVMTQANQHVLEFPEHEPIWSANIKRGIATMLQLDGYILGGAFVSNEFGLFGLCPTENFVVNNTDKLVISKIYDMDRCNPYQGGIFLIRSNIPLNSCQQEKRSHAITSRFSNYELDKQDNGKYMLTNLNAEMRTNVQASESYYPQFIFSKMTMALIKQTNITESNRLEFENNPKTFYSDFKYVVPSDEATGGRKPKTPDQVVAKTVELLTELADSLDQKSNFNEPYLETMSEIIRLVETMNYDTLRKLHDELNIGTSYTQETARNLFLEILPRAGTASSVLLTKDLVVNKEVGPSIAIQLLVSLPFFISEINADLVESCDDFLSIGPDRPDVNHAAVLSYSTIIYKAFTVGVITNDRFEKYVQKFVNLFLNSFDYEQQMLYVEALGNLQLGNVHNYLEPIIKANYSQNTDIRFLAILATMPTAYARPNEIFETYWPIFYNKNTPLQLRIAAFTMLLISTPTPGRLLGLYNVIKEETCPHMINFYRTTVLSISETTYSCFQSLKRLLLYMRRHLPEAPPKKYWITGNYIFDYKDRKFHIGSMLQTMLIGDSSKDLPMIAFLRFDTEALGRFTGQVGLYINARGFTDAIMSRLAKYTSETLKLNVLSEILKDMKMSSIPSTPLHLELVLQFEGKSVLSFYLNQTSFYNLTDGDILNRINILLRADSYVNMQIVRRPFMIKHSFATLFGTPADIFIENTVLTSMRGSTTQQLSMDKITRNNQIDFRYSSYGVAKIRSYNPIEDVEYSTIREQGFLVYLPLNNEIILNIISKSMAFSFYRTNIITSGISLKSRTRNFPGNRKVVMSQNGHAIKQHKFNIEDIGIEVLIGFNEESSMENLMFMLEADVLDNSKVFSKTPYSVLQHLLTVISLIQLNTIHIGRDKHFTILLTNEPNSKIEGRIKWDSEDFTRDSKGNQSYVLRTEFNLIHVLNYNSPNPEILHRWDFESKYTTFKNSKTSQIVMSLERKAKNGPKHKLCVTSTHDPMVFMKKPFTYSSIITFGVDDQTTEKCPVDKSQIVADFSYDLAEDVSNVYDNMIVNNFKNCSKEIIKFSPVPYTHACDYDQFKKLSSIVHYTADFKFEQMPDIFKDVASRIDHFISAMLPGQISRLGFTDAFKVSVKMPTDEHQVTKISINDVSATIPFYYHMDAKGIDQAYVSYGFESSCSILNDNFYTFNHKLTKLNEKLKNDFSLNNEILFAAECTDFPRLAVFVAYKEKSSDFDYVKVYIGGYPLIMRSANMSEPDIEFDGQKINIRSVPFLHPEHEPLHYDLRVSLSDENIVQIENQLIGAKIQYNIQNILSISIPSIYKGKICGVCNLHKKSGC